MRKSLIVVALGLAALGLTVAPSPHDSPAAAGVDSFEYDSWNVDYRIGLDDRGQALAKITETVSPVFPDFDQNRGIVRGIPIDYQGTSTDPRDFSVTDADGNPVPFAVQQQEGFKVVLVGNNRYVHGKQTYVISYTLSDVVLAPEDGGADEFYWDLADFERQQRIKDFNATITFSPELAPALNGNTRCYAGAPRSTEECELSGTGTEADPLRISALPLEPRNGVTVAIGLEPGAVTQPPRRLPNFALDWLPLIVGAAGTASGIVGAIAVSRMKRQRRTARGTIIAQYDVPPYLPPLIAGPIVGKRVSSPAAAEIVHLAVNGTLRLEDGAPGTWMKQPEHVIRVMDPARVADSLDYRTLATLVPGAVPGAARVVPRESTRFASEMQSLITAGDAEATARGYFERVRAKAATVFGIVSLTVAIGTVVFAIAALQARGVSPALLAFPVAIAGIWLGIWALVKHRVHTPFGAENREYLEGVRLFISVAEADRLRMLQSPQGAERRTVDGIEVIHLYERLLPYAMLFGLERQWAKALEVRYSTQPGYVPYWYPGLTSRGLTNIHGSLSSYTGALTSSVSYTASSTGGSMGGGGGFAGGGGGGGFSGGR